jgi:hypothetical protein
MGKDAKMYCKINLVLSDEKNYNNLVQNAFGTIRPYTMENVAKKHMDVFNKIMIQ